MKSYNIEWKHDSCTGWSSLTATTFLEVTTKFLASHPDYQILAIAEAGA